MEIRSYVSADYEQVANLYKQSELFGGQFDEDRDSKERLSKRVEADPDAILVAENENKIIGTISLIEDSRVAWLFRFCVEENKEKDEVADLLASKAEEILKLRGHNQILVYTSLEDENLNNRYKKLGFTQGDAYRCYWKNI